jgi:hypothetical protein
MIANRPPDSMTRVAATTRVGIIKSFPEMGDAFGLVNIVERITFPSNPQVAHPLGNSRTHLTPGST